MTADASPLFDRQANAIACRPALPIAISLITGIALFDCIPYHPMLWMGLVVVSLALACMKRRSAITSSAWLLLATALLGVLLAQGAEYRYSLNDVGNFASDELVLADVRFVIDHAPTLQYPPPMGGRPQSPKQVIIARAIALRGRGGWIDVDGQLLVQLSHPNPWLNLGQTAEGIGLFGHANPASNPGQIDWADVYRQRGIIATLTISHAENVHVLHDDGVGAIGWLRQESRHLLAAGFTVRRMTDYALLRALTLGDSNPDSRDTQNAFAQIGLAYQLSISGMHIVVLVAFAYLLCRLIRCSPRVSIIICAGIVVLYAVIALPSTASLRAACICVAALIAPLWWRTADKLQLLAIAAIGLALLDPMDVRTAGFQLGFVTVLGLAIFGPKYLKPVTFQAARRKQSRWKMLRDRVMLGIRAWLTLSVIAWLVSLPLVAFHFGQISPWAILVGIFMFPLVLVSLVGGWVKMLLTLLWPSIASLAARGVQIPVFGMRLLAIKFSHLPGASLSTVTPSITLIAIYYGLLLLLLVPLKRSWMETGKKTTAAIGIAVFIASILGCLPIGVAAQSSDELTVTLLNVGAGQCAIVSAPHESGVTLIDCGSDSITDVAKSVLIPALQSLHETTIARVVLSHSDYDHISALASVLPMLKGPVYTSSYFANFASHDPPAAALLEKLDAVHRSPTILQAGDHITVGLASIDVLWPTSDLNYNANDTGLVLRLNYANRSVLFPADIQANAMRALTPLGDSLHADVLIAPHHGSCEVTTAAFLEQIAAQFILASNGAVLTAKQRRFDEIVGKRWPLFRTNQFGCITVHIKQDSTVSITTYRGTRSVQSK